MDLFSAIVYGLIGWLLYKAFLEEYVEIYMEKKGYKTYKGLRDHI